MRLNVGCGGARFSNCINMDLMKVDPMIDIDVQGNVLALPFKEEAFTEVIFLHTIEHIKREHHIVALLEIWRVLKEKGRLILGFPDIIACMKGFINNNNGRRWDYYHKAIYGRQLHPGDYHLAGIERQNMTDILFSAGFKDIKYTLRDINGMMVAYKGEKLNWL